MAIRNIGRLRAGGNWTPASLSGLVAWYDPSDTASMYQDSAGTTPAAIGSPVGKANDKSGNGYHVTQGTAAARPALQQSGGLRLAYDGTDDALTSTNAALMLTGDITLVMAVSPTLGGYQMFASAQTDTFSQVAFEFRLNPSNNIEIYQAGTGSDTLASTGTVGGVSVVDFRRGSNSVTFGINAVESTAAQTATPQAGATPVFAIGSRTDAFGTLNGSVYGLAMYSRKLSASEIARVRTFLGSKCGLTL